ncbi:MAG: glycosyltransferase family 39 protein [Candidatus Micrarchaeota archaeon]
MNTKESIVFGAAIILGLAGFFLSYYTTNGNGAYWWDEGEYGILSRSLSTNGFFGFFGAPSFRSPMLPEFIAIFRALVGNLAWSVTIPFFSAMSAMVIFIIGKKLYDWKAGIIAGVAMLFSSLYIFYSGRMLTEIVGVFFSALSIYFFYQAFETNRKRDFILATLFIACGFLVFYRYLMVIAGMGLFAIIFRFSGLLKNWKNLLMSGALLLVILLPLFVYSTTYYGSPQGMFTTQYLGQSQVEPTEWFIYGGGQWMIFHIFSNELLVFLLIMAMIYALLFSKRELGYLSLMFLIIFISASVLLNHKEDRYLLPMFPVAYLAVGVFSAEIITKAYRGIRGFGLEGQKSEIAAFKMLGGVIVIVMLYYATFGNITPAFSLYESKKPSFGEVKQAAIFVRDNSLPDEVLMTDSVTAMFHSERPSIGFPPANITAMLDDVKTKKPSYLIIDVYESRDMYIQAINTFRNITTPTNSIEYVLLNSDKFLFLKAIPSEQSPYAMVFKIAQVN